MKKLLLALAVMLCLPLAASALPLTTQEIGDLVQECPSLDEYPDSPAIIWSRKQLYTQDSRKCMVKTVSYVILCAPHAHIEWLNDLMIAPNGGSIELEQAAIFDPGSVQLIKTLEPSASEYAKGRILLDLPQMSDDYILVLSYRQHFSKPDMMEDIAWLGSEYPTWEGSVQVRIAKDQELLYESSTGGEPTMNEDSNFRRYGWFYFKQPANRGMVSIVESADPYIVFSLDVGDSAAVEEMKELNGRSWPALPDLYIETEGSRREQALATIERFWRSPLRIRVDGIYRDAKTLPLNGPWTTWECAYIAAAWLESKGWKAEVWFQHALTQDRLSLSCVSGFSHPVLQLAEPGAKKSFYYVPGQPGEGEKIPAVLRGKTLYSAGGKRLRTKRISSTEMSKNRLTLAWDLKVDDQCNIDGILDIRVRQAWTESFEGLTAGYKEQIYALLPGIEGWINLDDDFEIKPLGSQGFKMVVPVKGRSGIIAPQGILVAMPSVTPGPFIRLSDVESSAVLKFPFVVEQNYKVKLPKDYRMLSVPIKQEQASMVNSYVSEYKFNKKTHTLEGEEKLIQNNLRVEAPYLDSFKAIIGTWGSWRINGLVLVPAKK